MTEEKEIQQSIIDTLEAAVGGHIDHDLARLVVDGLIARVRAYLIDEDAELPENPYKGDHQGSFFQFSWWDMGRAFLQGQQSVVDAGFRKVREGG